LLPAVRRLPCIAYRVRHHERVCFPRRICIEKRPCRRGKLPRAFSIPCEGCRGASRCPLITAEGSVLLSSACQRFSGLHFKYRAHRMDCCRLVNFLEGLDLLLMARISVGKSESERANAEPVWHEIEPDLWIAVFIGIHLHQDLADLWML